MSSIPDDSRLDALAQEFMDRQRAGARPTAEEYAARHPELAGAIRDLFPALEVMEEFGSVASPLTGPFVEPAPAGLPEHLGDYHILRELGRGGMGVVYEAVQESLGRHVALKVLPPHARENRVFLERFSREAKAAARLHHTNIVPVFGTGTHDGVPYYAMQFIRGQPLDAVLKELRRLDDAPDDTATLHPDRSAAQGLLTGRFECDAEGFGSPPPAEGSSLSLNGSDPHRGRFYRSVAEVGAQVADALAYAHSQGVVHRDVKPSNLLLDARGTVWVTDFGLAKAEGSAELTTSGDILGTLRFMSPEQLEGRADPRSDVYSLGVTLYELATLRPAFDDPVRVRLLNLVRSADPPRPRRLRPDMPRDLETVILKAMAKEPHRRYDSAHALAEDLRRVLADRPVLARRVTWVEAGWRWGRRNPGRAAMLAGLFALAVVIGVGGWVAAGRLNRQKQAEVAARRDAQEAQWRAMLSDARGLTISRRPGQRFVALEKLRAALALARELGLGDADKVAFRNAAVAALALPDVDEVRSWQGLPNGGGRAYRQFAFDATHTRYVHADSDGNVFLREVADERELARLTGFTTQPEVRLSPDASHLTVWEQHVEKLHVFALGWDAPRLVFAHPVPTYLTVAFTPDGRRVAFVTSDRKTVCVRDLVTGELCEWKPESPIDGSLSFSPDGRQLAVPLFDKGKGAIHFCDPATGVVAARLGLNGKCWHHAWHPDGRTFVTGGDRLDDELWDLPTGKRLATLPGHGHPGGYVQFTPDGSHLLTHDWSGRMRMVEVTSGREVLTFPYAGVTSDWSADGRHMGTAGDKPDDRLRILRYDPGRELRTVRPLFGGGYAGVADGQQRWIMTGGPDHLVAAGVTDPNRDNGHRSVALIDRRTGRAVAEIALMLDTVPIHISPAGHLFTDGPDGLLEWPRAEANGGVRFGPPQVRLPPYRGGGYARWTGGDGGVIVETARSRGLRVTPRRGPTVVTPPPGFDCRSAAVSPDGRWIAAGSFGKPADGHALKVYDAATGQPVAAIRVESNHFLGFSPDGRRLWTDSGGATFRADTWEAGPVLGGHRIAFSPDGAVAAVGDGLGLIRLHDAETGAELVRLTTFEQARLYPAGFSADGAELVAGSEVGQELQVWDLRRIRAGLAELGLDWAAPPYPPAPPPAPAVAVEVKIGGSLLNLQAERAEKEKRHKDAVAAWTKSLAADPNQPDVLRRLAQNLLSTAAGNDPKAALPHAQRLVELGPTWDAFDLRGRVHGALKDHRPSVADFDRALELCPPDKSAERAEILHHRSHAHEYLGDVARAEADIDAAIKLKANNAHYHAMRAGYRTTLDRPADAVADWKKSIEFDTSPTTLGAAWRSLATLYLGGPESVRDAKAGLAAAERAAALEKEPGAEALHLLGAAHVRNGNHAKAVERLTAVRVPGSFAGLNRLYLAMAHHHLGEADKARAALASALTWRKSAPKLAAGIAARFDALRGEVEALLAPKP